MAEMPGDYEALLDFVSLCPHGMAQFDGDGCITMLNPAFARLAMPMLVPGQLFSNFIEVLEPYLPDLRQLLTDPSAGMRAGTICEGLRIPLGAPKPGEERAMLSLTLVRFGRGQHMAVIEDITRQVAQERRLQESQAYFAALAQGVQDYAVFSVDADGLVSEWNISAERMFGHPAAAVIGTAAERLRTPDCGSHADLRGRLQHAARDGWHLDQGWWERADAGRFWGSCMLSPVTAPAEGVEEARFLMVVRDNTEQRNAAEELHRALTADHLTGVLNRRTFLERATAALRRQCATGTASCLAMLDADHFKTINDDHGHAGGDAALRAIGAALRDGVRGETLVGRLGGEEFAILMPDTTTDIALPIIERLRATIGALELAHDGRPIRLTVSAGLAAGGAADLQVLLQAADVALYAAKRAGRDCTRIADSLHTGDRHAPAGVPSP